MTLPKLTESEYEEIYEDYIWFLSVSKDFFDNMYGNIYNDYCEEEEYSSSEEEDEE